MVKIQKHNLGKTLGKGGDVVLQYYARQKVLNQANIVTSEKQGSRIAINKNKNKKKIPLLTIFKLFQL